MVWVKRLHDYCNMIKQQSKHENNPVHHSTIPEEVRHVHMYYLYVWQFPYISIYVCYSKYYYKELNVIDSSMILTTTSVKIWRVILRVTFILAWYHMILLQILDRHDKLLRWHYKPLSAAVLTGEITKLHFQTPFPWKYLGTQFVLFMKKSQNS